MTYGLKEAHDELLSELEDLREKYAEVCETSAMLRADMAHSRELREKLMEDTAENKWAREFLNGIAERIKQANAHSLVNYVETIEDKNAKLRELVRDYINAPCTTCDCWQDEFRCWNYDGADCGLVARARELKIEVER